MRITSMATDLTTLTNLSKSKERERQYVIHWRSDITGHSGHGTSTFPAEEAKRIASRLNEQDRDSRIYHWTEPVGEEEA